MGEQRAADARGQVAATASELRARGHRWAASWAVVRELVPACYYARVGQWRGDVKGWAGSWLHGLGRAAGWEAFFFFSFLCFSFLFHLFKFKFGLLL